MTSTGPKNLGPARNDGGESPLFRRPNCSSEETSEEIRIPIKEGGDRSHSETPRGENKMPTKNSRDLGNFPATTKSRKGPELAAT